MVKEFNFTKREFLQELFKEYNELPFRKCLKNFAKVFNDLFLHGKTDIQAHYIIREVQVVELQNMNTPQESFNVQFKHNFCAKTSHYVDFLASEHYKHVVKAICSHVKNFDNLTKASMQKRGTVEEQKLYEQSIIDR